MHLLFNGLFMNSSLGKVKIWNLQKVFSCTKLCVCDFWSIVITFRFPDRDPFPIFYLLSYHTFKDSKIYDDIIFVPDNLEFSHVKKNQTQQKKPKKIQQNTYLAKITTSDLPSLCFTCPRSRVSTFLKDYFNYLSALWIPHHPLSHSEQKCVIFKASKTRKNPQLYRLPLFKISTSTLFQWQKHV